MPQVAAASSDVFRWQWQDQPAVTVRYSTLGEGPLVLLLPAFSTVSSREEMAPLTACLAPRFRSVTPDWPGFGLGRQPRLEHAPALHLAFLDAFTRHIASGPVGVLAAGHAAGYVLALSGLRPGVWSRIVLVAPTWRGPLPTMMGRRHPVQRRIAAAIRMPVLGSALYRLNVMPAVIAAMYRRHVYADPGHLTPALLAAKAEVARRPGGRFGSGAFVTGGLDIVADRAGFLALARPPLLMLYGADTPPKSRADMQALADLPGVVSQCLARGALGVHEEFPAEVARLSGAYLAMRDRDNA